MRTDSVNLSETALQAAASEIKSAYGDKYHHLRVYKTKSAGAQEAHEAIRPSNFGVKHAGHTDDQKRLYELIWQRAVASQMADALIKRTKILANVTDAKEAIPDFAQNGSRVVFPGWLTVDTRARGEDVEVPTLKAGDALTLKRIEAEAKETQPPSRYTEAGLIKELEKRGIGRPSTYASIMHTIIERGYVLKEGRTLLPTDTGDLVSSFLEEHFTDYIGDNFTSEMEDKLDDIANGEREYVKTLREFYTPFSAAVAAKEDIAKITNLGAGPKEFPCPTCGSTMVIKLGKTGKFLSCDRYPDCKGARLIDGSDLKDDEPLGLHPETGDEIYLLNGKFGPYVQIGKTPEKIKGKKQPNPKRASLPKDKKPSEVTLADAVHYLILPRDLGIHPETGEMVMANTGRFGPYIGHAGEFRSLKSPDTPYEISFERAIAILKEPKNTRSGEKLVKEVGVHPKTKKMICVYESKSGKYMRRGFKRIMLPDTIDLDGFGVEEAVALMSFERNNK